MLTLSVTDIVNQCTCLVQLALVTHIEQWMKLIASGAAPTPTPSNTIDNAIEILIGSISISQVSFYAPSLLVLPHPPPSLGLLGKFQSAAPGSACQAGCFDCDLAL